MINKEIAKSDRNRYDDIINMPHHTSPTRTRMSMLDRAAQFSPFAALTGHGAAIEEMARLTDDYIELDEYEKTKINEELQRIYEHIKEQPEISMTFFEPDVKKDGGKYVKMTGNVKKIDEYEKCLVMIDGSRILVDRILELNYNRKK